MAVLGLPVSPLIAQWWAGGAGAAERPFVPFDRWPEEECFEAGLLEEEEEAASPPCLLLWGLSKLSTVASKLRIRMSRA